MAHPFVDLRSDTVTRPTPEMIEAMVSAPLGDDVLGDDPTVQKLEAMAAKKVGMEAALYVPSGTMGNQIALATHCQRADVVLAEDNAHILYYEVGAPAVIAGVLTRNVPSEKGVMKPADVEARVMTRSLHTPGTTLLCIENTHNRAGGTITPVEVLKEYRAIADRNGMAIHMDGARLFNAAVALNTDVTAWTTHCDSVSFCLSKGLRAPIGSMLCGTTAFIDAARIWRKRLGGGMRQAGIIAAAGIYALENNIGRLADDHRRAKAVAKAISKLEGFTVDADGVQTNIVMVDTKAPAAEVCSRLEQLGVWCFPFSSNRLRLVFHADVDDDDVSKAIEAFSQLAPQIAGAAKA